VGRYKQLFDNKPFVHPLDHILVFQCCDCGLVHNINIEYVDKRNIKLVMTKNKRRTTAVRAARMREKAYARQKKVR
jgi:uncharacterized Zn finger protein